ncbi:uncharacterized protein LOC103973505 isoform X4 [Musa acuminata AAA Group]|uniref:uncharacterized protein LOC103973505 isoform X4 n=1 Tax=Musa acuminata AAA Group TaxID=214697 RepID=UPI0031DAC972
MLLQRCSSLLKAGSSRSRFRGEDELLGSVCIGALGLMETAGASTIQSLFLNLHFLCRMPLHSKMQAIHLNRGFYMLHLLSLRFPFCHRVLHLLVNLLTPSSPEVPVAKLLFTSLDTNCKKSEVYKLQSYQFYPGSPIGCLISPSLGCSGIAARQLTPAHTQNGGSLLDRRISAAASIEESATMPKNNEHLVDQ